MTLQSSVLPSNQVQQTAYVYGYSGPQVSSNDLLAAIQHPDKQTGLPSTSSADQETFAYNALDQGRTVDRNNTVHSFLFDVLGRPTTEKLSNLGGGVDGAVQCLDTAYDTGGPRRASSLASASTRGPAHCRAGTGTPPRRRPSAGGRCRSSCRPNPSSGPPTPARSPPAGRRTGTARRARTAAPGASHRAAPAPGSAPRRGWSAAGDTPARRPPWPCASAGVPPARSTR